MYSVCVVDTMMVAHSLRGEIFGPAQRLPNAMRGGETSLAFMVHPTLEPADLEATAEVVCEVMNEACRA